MSRKKRQIRMIMRKLSHFDEFQKRGTEDKLREMAPHLLPPEKRAPIDNKTKL